MRIFKVICLILSLLFVGFSVFYGNKKIDPNFENGSVSDSRYILKVWHVTTFEGGVGSRRNFLDSIAKEYEKKNKNALFLVTEVSAEELSFSISNNDLPDIISYSPGVDIFSLQKLNINRDFPSGKIDKNTYSVPWAYGGYFIISKDELNLEKKDLTNAVISKTDYTLPQIALLLNDFSFFGAKLKTPTNAYYDFVSNRADILVGTQRDLFRLSAKNINFYAKFLSGFSDLFNYVGVLSNSSVKKEIAQDFISYLVSDSVQNRLNKIGLFSPYKTGLYSDEIFSSTEKTLPYSTFSPFLGKTFYQTLTSNFEKENFAEDEEKLKIKNMLIYLDKFIKV